MLDRLDHVTILAGDLDASVAFYEGVLGLARGPRPPFGFPGAWLYLAERPVIHLIGGCGRADGTGTIDHLAFHAQGVDATRARLTGLGIAFEERVVPGQGLIQLFVRDPNGVRVELNFDAPAASS
ncbi:MAG: glyoxalase [Alphaproteobacteria bacterium]|nr:glyoxalase [Alphaproteobacteria bacterium]